MDLHREYSQWGRALCRRSIPLFQGSQHRFHGGWFWRVVVLCPTTAGAEGTFTAQDERGIGCDQREERDSTGEPPLSSVVSLH